MWTYNYSEIYHHGILGQRWGKRNGPPYPLSSSDHSASERKAGWRKSLSGGINSEKDLTRKGDKGYNKGSGKQRKTIAAGANATDTSLAAIGNYKLAKSDKFNSLINSGRKKSKSLLVGNADGILKKLSKPETLSETLKNVNPHLGEKSYDNNCTYCSVAGYLRGKGYNVIAGNTNGQNKDLGKVIGDCFIGADITDVTAKKFGRSVNDAKELLRKLYGNDAEGCCAIQWKNSEFGHAFNWKIIDGIVTFIDFQQGKIGSDVEEYWSKIEPSGMMTLARLDRLSINPDEIKKVVE